MRGHICWGRSRSARCDETTRGSSQNFQGMSDQVRGGLRMRASQRDIDDGRHNSNQYSVQDEARIDTPADPDREQEAHYKRGYRRNVQQRMLARRHQDRNYDDKDGQFGEEAADQGADPVDSRTIHERLPHRRWGGENCSAKSLMAKLKRQEVPCSRHFLAKR